MVEAISLRGTTNTSCDTTDPWMTKEKFVKKTRSTAAQRLGPDPSAQGHPNVHGHSAPKLLGTQTLATEFHQPPLGARPCHRTLGPSSPFPDTGLPPRQVYSASSLHPSKASHSGASPKSSNYDTELEVTAAERKDLFAKL